MSIALTAAVGGGLLVARQSPAFAIGGAHAVVWLIAIGYLFGVRMVYLDQRIAACALAEQPPTIEESRPRGKFLRYVLGFVGAAAVIFLVGPHLAEAAGEIAERSGLGSSFVGTTFVALSTSLPKLVASITALRLGALDLVIGNVFGSNAINTLLFLPLDRIFPGTLFAVASPVHVITVLTVVLATSVVIMGQLY